MYHVPILQRNRRAACLPSLAISPQVFFKMKLGVCQGFAWCTPQCNLSETPEITWDSLRFRFTSCAESLGYQGDSAGFSIRLSSLVLLFRESFWRLRPSVPPAHYGVQKRKNHASYATLRRLGVCAFGFAGFPHFSCLFVCAIACIFHEQLYMMWNRVSHLGAASCSSFDF